MEEAEAINLDEVGVEGSAKMLREYVSDALGSESLENNAPLPRLMVELRHLIRQSAQRQEAPSRRLCALLSALSDCVGSLNEKKHRDLFEAILEVRLQLYATAVQRAFLEVILSLACANTALVAGCVRNLVINLIPYDVPPRPTFDENGRWVAVGSVDKLQDNIVQTLGKIVAIVPTVVSCLASLLEAKAPFPQRPTDAHCLFVRAILTLMSYPYTAIIKDQLLGVGISHLLRIDVFVGREVEEHRGRRADGSTLDDRGGDVVGIFQDDVFELELDENSYKDEQKGSATEPVQGALDPMEMKQCRVTLDLLMEMWFEHFNKRCKVGQLDELWRIVLGMFESRLVNAVDAMCTPYLIFYLATRDSTLSAQFVKYCLERVLSPSMPAMLRCSYASYLASFLSRCGLLSVEDVVSTLSALVGGCEQTARRVDQRKANHKFRQLGNANLGEGEELSNLQKHQVFYNLFQGVLYVLCYRMREVLGESGKSGGSLGNTLRDLVCRQLGPLLHHSLDPINVCSSAVAVQFAHQASVLGLLQCTDMIQMGDLLLVHKKLDANFPFDPYPLPKSSHHFDFGETYIKWQDRRMDVEVAHSEKTTNVYGKPTGSYGSWPKDIPNNRCDPDDESHIEDLSLSAGLSPMSIAYG